MSRPDLGRVPELFMKCTKITMGSLEGQPKEPLHISLSGVDINMESEWYVSNGLLGFCSSLPIGHVNNIAELHFNQKFLKIVSQKLICMLLLTEWSRKSCNHASCEIHIYTYTCPAPSSMSCRHRHNAAIVYNAGTRYISGTMYLDEYFTHHVWGILIYTIYYQWRIQIQGCKWRA